MLTQHLTTINFVIGCTIQDETFIIVHKHFGGSFSTLVVVDS